MLAHPPPPHLSRLTPPPSAALRLPLNCVSAASLRMGWWSLQPPGLGDQKELGVGVQTNQTQVDVGHNGGGCRSMRHSERDPRPTTTGEESRMVGMGDTSRIRAKSLDQNQMQLRTKKLGRSEGGGYGAV